MLDEYVRDALQKRLFYCIKQNCFFAASYQIRVSTVICMHNKYQNCAILYLTRLPSRYSFFASNAGIIKPPLKFTYFKVYHIAILYSKA